MATVELPILSQVRKSPSISEFDVFLCLPPGGAIELSNEQAANLHCPFFLEIYFPGH